MQTYPSCLTHHSYIFTCLYHCCSVTKSCPSVTPWTEACQPSLSFVISLNLLKLLGCKEIQLVHPKGNQSWIFIGRTMLKLKLQYFGHLMWRADLFEKTLMLGNSEGRRRRGRQRMRCWMASPTKGHGFGWTMSVGDGQGGLACCSSLGCKESDTTERLNWTELIVMPSNHLIVCHSFCLLPSIFPSISVFSNESALCIRWPKYWSFSISSSNEYSGLIPFRNEWFELLAVQGTLKESSPATQFKSISSSVLSLLYAPTLTSIYDYKKSHSFDYTDLCLQSDVSAF